MAPVWNTSATSHQADLINSLSFIKTFMNLRRDEFPAETAPKKNPRLAELQSSNVNITLKTGEKFAN